MTVLPLILALRLAAAPKVWEAAQAAQVEAEARKKLIPIMRGHPLLPLEPRISSVATIAGRYAMTGAS